MAKTLAVEVTVKEDGAVRASTTQSYSIDEAVTYEFELANATTQVFNLAATLSIRALLIVSDRIVYVYTPSGVALPYFGKVVLVTGDASTAVSGTVEIGNSSGSTANVKLYTWGT